MTLTFRKVEGLGNDFLLIDRTAATPAALESELPALQEAASRLCDRRTGVGGDGLLIIGPPDADTDGSMIVVNHDGSRPEMCGNGLRCVAQHLGEQRGTDALRIQTDAGVKPCSVSRVGDRVEVGVDMGPGVDLGDLRIANGRVFRGVSMGNPHAIAFVEDDPERLARTEGPSAEVDDAFPNRTNVEFARLRDDAITLWVWERGCGITQACGTGACATACAAVWTGRRDAGTPLAVDLPGGRLWITVPEDRDAGVHMRGPARVVFDGSVAL
ncbi:MAG: diaminopimelate epimerase [Nannocystaceae bacterium]|nr:diaminopimelate epimerase [bacterium]